MESSIKIVSFSLIGESKKGDLYRHVVFKDEKNQKTADYLVYKKLKPGLWDDIEKLEKGGNLPPYSGYIARFNGLDIVVLGEETLKDAFDRQKWRLDIYKKISLQEANEMREVSCGCRTNLTSENCIDISWREFDQGVKMVRFRSYLGKGLFQWGKWFEVE